MLKGRSNIRHCTRGCARLQGYCIDLIMYLRSAVSLFHVRHLHVLQVLNGPVEGLAHDFVPVDRVVPMLHSQEVVFAIGTAKKRRVFRQICEHSTEPLGHSFMEVLIKILLEVAAGVYGLPGLHGSCSSAHQPSIKSEPSVT